MQSWIDQLRWQRLKPFQDLAWMLLDYLDGILNYCRTKVPFGARPLLSTQFYLAGKGRTRFVRSERLAEVRQKVANYKRFRELTDEGGLDGGTGTAGTGAKAVRRWKSILTICRRK